MPNTRKVRFVEPRSRPGRPFNAWIRRWPLLGPLTLATILHERGYDAAIYNENISGPLSENPQGWADVTSADVVGISIMTPTAARGYALADAVRRDAPQATVVLGGVHATFMPQEALAHADVVVCGEGERVIEAIARGEIRRGIVRPEPPDDLDAIPTLDHGLILDFDRLLGRCRRRELYELPVMTSRGCPYGCTYCSVTRMFGRKVRRRSVAKVHEDICRHMDRGFRHFFFYDDNFTADRAWTRALLERLAPLRLRFNAQSRADFYWIDAGRQRRDEALLRAMRRAGGDVLYVGYETIDDATARQWHKGYRGEACLESRLREDTRVLHESGLWVHAMFVLGPQHTERTAERIVAFSRAAGIETMQISILTPLPGTPLMEQMRPHLVLTDFPDDWDYYDGTHCVYDHSVLGAVGLQETLLAAHRRFYGWLGWSGRRLRALARQRAATFDKLAQLWANARTARAVLREWRGETEAFLRLLMARRAGRLACEPLELGGRP
jgi:radical SAM superfamily enzyme YgiQ (UPF0313 family)